MFFLTYVWRLSVLFSTSCLKRIGDGVSFLKNRTKNLTVWSGLQLPPYLFPLSYSISFLLPRPVSFLLPSYQCLLKYYYEYSALHMHLVSPTFSKTVNESQLFSVTSSGASRYLFLRISCGALFGATSDSIILLSRDLSSSSASSKT